MNPVILISCFTPLIIIFLVMKLTVWVSAVNTENSSVGKEPLRKREPFVADAYAAVGEKEEEYGDRKDYR